jgi:hypothetical protein
MKTLMIARVSALAVLAALAVLLPPSLVAAADGNPSAPAAKVATAAATPQAEGAPVSFVAVDDGAAVEDDAEVEAAADDAQLSPSQVSADRINAIRANEYFYQSYGKGDPFSVLVNGDFEQTGAAELVDANSARLVGVMWGQDDRFALVEDGEGFGYILRVGDQVRNGRVVSIRKSSLTAQVSLYGITSNVVLKLDNLEE